MIGGPGPCLSTVCGSAEVHRGPEDLGAAEERAVLGGSVLSTHFPSPESALLVPERQLPLEPLGAAPTPPQHRSAQGQPCGPTTHPAEARAWLPAALRAPWEGCLAHQGPRSSNNGFNLLNLCFIP